MSFKNPVTLADWLAMATQEQREELARRANTSSAYLYQLATGRRSASADKAAAIEAATMDMAKDGPSLPPVLRTSSCNACATCPLAKYCGG